MNSYCENHLIQAQKDRALFLLYKDNFKDEYFYNWIFVIAFYSALHYFSAFYYYKYEKKLPTYHSNKSEHELGGFELAKKCFCTNKNQISDAIGKDYKTLFNWRYNVCYDPERSKLLSQLEVEVAFKIIERIRIITLNEIGKGVNGKFEVIDVDFTLLKQQYEKNKRNK